MRILPSPQSPAALEALEYMRALRRARQREAFVASAAVTDEVANRDPATKPEPLPVPPLVERPLLAWPWRVLGGIAIAAWGTVTVVYALAVAVGVVIGSVLVGALLVMGLVYVAQWVPVLIAAPVITVLVFLGMWAVIRR